MYKFADNPVYLEQERLLLELHRLIAAGLCDDAQADAVRDEIDVTWWDLSPDEQERIGGLSSDLYMLQHEEVFDAVEDRETAVALEAQLDHALHAKRWVEVLNLLRRRPRDASSEWVALLRGRAYSELGHSGPAALFFDYALGLNHEKSSAAAAVYSPKQVQVAA